MGQISLQIPQVGQPDTTEDVKVQNDLTTIQTVINGNIDSTNINPSAAIAYGQMARGAGRLAISDISVATNAVSGFMYVVTAGAPFVIALPAPSADAVVGVFIANAGTTTACVVQTNGVGNIYGAGLLGTSFQLGAQGAFAVLRSDGSNWFITAGRQDTGWVALTLANGWVAGARAPAVRLIGDRVWLKGFATSGSTTGVSTVPTFAKPTDTTVSLPTAQGVVLSIGTAGALTYNSVSSTCAMDGLSYTLS